MPKSAFGVEIAKDLSHNEKKGLLVGGVGGLAGPPGSAAASGYLGQKGRKGRAAAIGAGGGFLGPVGGAAAGYHAATTKPKKKIKKDATSAFGVDHS